MNPLFNLDGKVAIVTGGSQGLGEAIAKGLAKAGAKIAVASRNLKKLEMVAADIRKMGGHAEPFKCDISKSQDVEEFVGNVMNSFSKVDILINNAGFNFPPKPLVDFPEENWNRVIDVNLKGMYLLCRSICPGMIDRKEGRIINVSSIAGSVGFVGMGPYGAAKAGMILLTKVLALELAEHNITVNGVAPGFFDTPMNDQNIKDKKDVVEFTIERTPLRRWGQPDELVGLVLLLSSGASTYITGQTIFVDGGWTIW